MTKTSKTIIFFGNERLATGVKTEAPTLQALINAGYHVAAVVSNFERGKSRAARELEIGKIAEAHNIPLLLPGKPADILEELKSYDAEAAVLAAYGRIVPQSVIDIFPKGIINIHPSLLPLHRGPTPIESVILQGKQTTGVSIMSLVKEMDAGPVYGYAEYPLNGTETKQSLADDLLNLGSTMLIELLPGILDGSLIAKPQDDKAATYDKLISKDDGILDFAKPAHQLEREIRAFADWPKSRMEINGADVVITEACVNEKSLQAGTIVSENTHLLIGTAEKSLEIKKLKPAGKGEMTAQAFLAGYGKKLGVL